MGALNVEAADSFLQKDLNRPLYFIVDQCKKQPTRKIPAMQGLSQAAPLRQSRTAIETVPLKNGQGEKFVPFKFKEKTRKEAHTKRFLSVLKLQAETERGKYILPHL